MNFKKILQNFHKRDEVLTYISQGVSVYNFFKHFKGQFKGENGSPLPPKTSVASAVANKLTQRLTDFQIHNDLTMHSFRGKLCHCWVCITSE